MHRRHPWIPDPLPRRWLMTDERQGDRLWAALATLPRGSGVVFRHYSLGDGARRALLARVMQLARKRRLLVLVGGRDRLGHGRVGSHGRHHGALSVPVHSRREARSAVRAGARLLFVSPVHPTRSHPGATVLGGMKLGLVIHGLKVPVVALGGMNARRWRALKRLNIHGWAGIDAWDRPKRPH